MKRSFLILVLTLMMAVGVSGVVRTDYQHETASMLKTKLAQATSATDSICILYDLFDVLPRSEGRQIGDRIYEIATRTGDNTTRLDICRQMTAYFSDDHSLAEIEKVVSQIPESQEQKETHLFLRMKRLSLSSRTKTEADRQSEIIRILSEEDSKTPKSANQRLLDLFTLVEYLRNDASGDMLKEYLDRLIALATSSHFKLYAIPNIVYAEAANVYADAGEAEKSVEADRKLLTIIDGLEKKYREKGRLYRSYDISRYVCYRRMMRNYEALRPGELEDLYARSMKLRENNIDIRNDIDSHPRFYAYYHTAAGDYTAAIPYLKRMLDEENSLPVRKQVLEFLIDAAGNTGDDDTKVKALEEYSTILEELNRLKASERYRELQIKYDVQDLRTRNAELELENRSDEIMSARRLMTFVAVAFIILLAILVISLYHWGRFKRNASSMGEVVDNIRHERERLRNSIYYDAASQTDPLGDDEVSESWQERMRGRGVKWDQLSLFMTKSIINDLLFIAATGHADLQKYIHETSVDSVMRKVESLVRESGGREGSLSVEHVEDDFSITSDEECLCVIMKHIYDTAVKYSPESLVTLSCRRVGDDHIDFVITTKGVSAAGPDDPQIFDNLLTARKVLHRKGAGLFICRMITLLLDCQIIPDSSYQEGARYYFRIPVTPEAGRD